MNRYIVRAKRLQTIEIMVTGWDEDDAFDAAMESTEWDVIDTHEPDDVFVTNVTHDINYQEEA